MMCVELHEILAAGFDFRFSASETEFQVQAGSFAEKKIVNIKIGELIGSGPKRIRITADKSIV